MQCSRGEGTVNVSSVYVFISISYLDSLNESCADVRSQQRHVGKREKDR